MKKSRDNTITSGIKRGPVRVEEISKLLAFNLKGKEIKGAGIFISLTILLLLQRVRKLG